MEELLRTNDIVLISFVESLLKDAGIVALVVDQNMSVMDGSLGILPRRVLVPGDDLDKARQILVDAGVGKELEKPKGEG
jgi:Putative prokaryotic signal transducing protein